MDSNGKFDGRHWTTISNMAAELVRFLRLFALIFGFMLLVGSGVLAVGHQQSTDGLWEIAFTHYVDADDQWYFVEVLPTGIAIEKPTALMNDLVWSPNNEWVLFRSIHAVDGIYVARLDRNAAMPISKNRFV